MRPRTYRPEGDHPAGPGRRLTAPVRRDGVPSRHNKSGHSWEDSDVPKWWDTRAGRTLIVATSALAFGAIGLLWTRITGQWGGGAYCIAPPPLPGHRGGAACFNSSPNWGWIVSALVICALVGSLMAVVGLNLHRTRPRNPGNRP